MDGWKDGAKAETPGSRWQVSRVTTSVSQTLRGFSDRKSATNGLRRKAAAPAPALYRPASLSSVIFVARYQRFPRQDTRTLLWPRLTISIEYNYTVNISEVLSHKHTTITRDKKRERERERDEPF